MNIQQEKLALARQDVSRLQAELLTQTQRCVHGVGSRWLVFDINLIFFLARPTLRLGEKELELSELRARRDTDAANLAASENRLRADIERLQTQMAEELQAASERHVKAIAELQQQHQKALAKAQSTPTPVPTDSRGLSRRGSGHSVASTAEEPLECEC